MAVLVSVAVLVAVAVLVSVVVAVSVAVTVPVNVAHGVLVDVGVNVSVAVLVLVAVDVIVAVAVAVSVSVAAHVTVGASRARRTVRILICPSYESESYSIEMMSPKTGTPATDHATLIWNKPPDVTFATASLTPFLYTFTCPAVIENGTFVTTKKS